MPGLSFSKLSGTGGGDGSSHPQPGRNQGYGYESFGEQTNNSQNPPRPPRSRRKGGDFAEDHDDDDDDDDDDDHGSGVYEHRRAKVIGWCDIRKKKVLVTQGYVSCVSCNKRLMHVKCLNAIGRNKPECLQCEEIKVKMPYNNPDGYDDGDGGPYWGRGRRDRERENRDRKPTREDVISKLATRTLPKLDVKNAHDISAIELKLLWDTWLTQVSHTFNLWSTVAATTFRKHLEDAQERHEKWNQLPNVEKLEFERQYTYGLGQLPPVQEFLEGHMRFSLTQAIPRSLADKLDAYAQYTVPDILFLVMKEIFPK
eukprot:4768754-Amphidinium_carterae.3